MSSAATSSAAWRSRRESPVLIAVAVVAINVTIGVVLGLLAGYFGGVVEQVIMGIADLQLAVPVLILLVAIIAVFRGRASRCWSSCSGWPSGSATGG